MYCRRLGVTARLRALLWMAAALYTFGLYSEVGFQSCILLLMLAWRMDLHARGVSQTRLSGTFGASPETEQQQQQAALSARLLPALQAQFYAHAVGLDPSEQHLWNHLYCFGTTCTAGPVLCTRHGPEPV